MAFGAEKHVRIVVSAVDRTNAIFSRLSAQSSVFEATMTRITRAASVGIAAVGAAVTALGFGFNAMQERAQVSFGVLTKNVALGKRFIADLFAFVKDTPLDFGQAVKSAQTLYARGFALKDLIPILEAVGDTAAAIPGDAADASNRIILALSQIQAKGRVQAEEMTRQLGQVIPAWEYLAEAIGISIPEAMEKAKRGEISSATAIKAILDGMRRDFGGTMEAISKTASGRVTVMIREFKRLSGVFTEGMFDKASSSLGRFVKLLQDPSTEQWARRAGENVDRFVSNVARGFNSTVIPAFSWIVSNQYRIAAAVGVIAAAFLRFNPALGTLTAIVLALEAIGMHEAGLGSKGLNELSRMEAEQRQKVRDARKELEKNAWGVDRGRFQENLEREQSRLDEILNAVETRAAQVNPPTPELPPYPDEAPPPEFDQMAADAADKFSQDLKSALTDGLIDVAEALELGITPAAAAAYEAEIALAEGLRNTREQTYETTKAIEKINAVYSKNAALARDMVVSLQREQMARIQEAAAKVFGEPTQEQAQMEHRIAQLEEQRMRMMLGRPEGAEPTRPMLALDAEIQSAQAALQLSLQQTKVLSTGFQASRGDLLTSFQQSEAAQALMSASTEVSGWIRSTISGYRDLVPEIGYVYDGMVNLKNILASIPAALTAPPPAPPPEPQQHAGGHISRTGSYWLEEGEQVLARGGQGGSGSGSGSHPSRSLVIHGDVYNQHVNQGSDIDELDILLMKLG